MNYRYFLLLLLLMLAVSPAKAQIGAIDNPETSPSIDIERLESLVSRSEMVLLAEIKAISSVRRDGPEVRYGPWIVTEYVAEVDEIILSSVDPVPDTLAFVTYGGNLRLPTKLNKEDEKGSVEIGPGPSDPAGYKAIFQRFGAAESVTHTPRITRTGTYLIFIQTTRQRRIFDDLHLLSAFKVNERNGADVINVSQSTKVQNVSLEDMALTLSTLSGSLDTFEPGDPSSQRGLHVVR